MGGWKAGNFRQLMPEGDGKIEDENLIFYLAMPKLCFVINGRWGGRQGDRCYPGGWHCLFWRGGIGMYLPGWMCNK
jgi:hypothetical protein